MPIFNNENMKIIYTTGKNMDFADLCRQLDDDLNILAGGEQNRMEYVEHNKLDDIHDVIVAYHDKTPIACASFKHIEDSIAEVKRVFVKKEYRGRGISKIVMQEIEKKAKEKGYSDLILETGKDMASAVGLYRSLGYSLIPNYGQYKDMPKSVCMKKTL